MIQFFRKIRQGLLTENKFNKYLLYAMGEIVLVVIGILIALQINTWNENRKMMVKEDSILRGLKLEMLSNLRELKADYESELYFSDATNDVYKYIQNKSALVDSMYTDFFAAVQFNYFFPKSSSYESLKAGNLEIIKSDTLRELISDIYESSYQRLHDKRDTRRNAARLLFPYYQKHFRTVSYQFPEKEEKQFVGIPVDYDFIINDHEFETLLVEALLGRANFVASYHRSVNDVEKCIVEIDRYLSR